MQILILNQFAHISSGPPLPSASAGLPSGAGSGGRCSAVPGGENSLLPTAASLIPLELLSLSLSIFLLASPQGAAAGGTVQPGSGHQALLDCDPSAGCCCPFMMLVSAVLSLVRASRGERPFCPERAGSGLPLVGGTSSLGLYRPPFIRGGLQHCIHSTAC